MGIAYDVIILHYSEIYLKSKYVKRIFQQILLSNIKLKLNKYKNQISRIINKDNSLYYYDKFIFI